MGHPGKPGKAPTTVSFDANSWPSLVLTRANSPLRGGTKTQGTGRGARVPPLHQGALWHRNPCFCKPSATANPIFQQILQRAAHRAGPETPAHGFGNRAQRVWPRAVRRRGARPSCGQLAAWCPCISWREGSFSRRGDTSGGVSWDAISGTRVRYCNSTYLEGTLILQT